MTLLQVYYEHTFLQYHVHTISVFWRFRVWMVFSGGENKIRLQLLCSCIWFSEIKHETNGYYERRRTFDKKVHQMCKVLQRPRVLHVMARTPHIMVEQSSTTLGNVYISRKIVNILKWNKISKKITVNNHSAWSDQFPLQCPLGSSIYLKEIIHFITWSNIDSAWSFSKKIQLRKAIIMKIWQIIFRKLNWILMVLNKTRRWRKNHSC